MAQPWKAYGSYSAYNEWFLREEKKRLDMPDERDEDFLARVYGRNRIRNDASHNNDAGTSTARRVSIERPEAVNTDVAHNEEQNTPIPLDAASPQQSGQKRKAPAERTAEHSQGVSKKRRLSPEHAEGSASECLKRVEGSTSSAPEVLTPQRAADIPASGATAHQRGPALDTPIVPSHNRIMNASPVPDVRQQPKPANTLQRPLSPVVDVGARNIEQPVPSSSRIIPTEAQATSNDVVKPPKTRSSNHAVRKNAALISKVIKVFGGGSGPDAAHSSSSVTTPAASGPSSSKANLARGKAAAEPKTKTGPLKNQKSGKKKRELVTPLEYAQRLQDQLSEMAATRKSRVSPYLRGKRIYYYGGDMKYASEETRGRMDHIVKHGGTIVPIYDPSIITHIVTTDHPPKSAFLQATGLRSLSEIPDHIPTVKWSWVASRRGNPGVPARKGAEKTEPGADDPDGDKTEQIEEDSSEPPANFNLMFHAVFKERLDAGIPSCMSKGGSKAQKVTTFTEHGISRPTLHKPSGRDTSGISTISEFTVDRIEPKDSTIICGFDESSYLGKQPSGSSSRLSEGAPVAGSSRDALRSKDRATPEADPLAPFYEQAREEREAEDARPGLSSDDEQDEEIDSGGKRGTTHAASKKRGFLCDSKPEEDPECANQDVIDKLQELKELHKAKLSVEDNWRVYTYDKAIRALRSYPKRIRSYDEAHAIRGIGDKTAQKIIEILQTGELRRIGYERTEDVEAINMFQGIYGVGRQTAFKWYASGCRNLDDIRTRKGGIKLSTCQEIGLRHYADINSRMPRTEAADIFNMIKPIALQIDPKLFVEIMGSYRRGKADCGDIDILITRPTDDGKTHQWVLRKLLGELHHRGIITEDLSLPDSFDDLELVYRGLCRRDSSSQRRRIDFLTVPYKSRGAALLYYTGDDIFNRSLRLKANKMGYSLNQKGLFQGVVRNPSNKLEKLNEGTIVASETEEEILQILGVPWQEPHERIRG
ncbi:uncharacterized protein B0H18DRAFT_996945 [Fomitopsis serialis]|uniref:uncharacterized protein n=1 Tax=Fomitopsis serialis TaxID=139415 RepID=UPI0020085664|nr:uncharacterized protein B0H18DRAFT_996945 [Neoantrodia serialis]KAH9929394.1 hypothetical protein B0H18DRAFT_996945 [Neoantrodia serialis]